LVSVETGYDYYVKYAAGQLIACYTMCYLLAPAYQLNACKRSKHSESSATGYFLLL
jgi:hypothetical protein